MSSSSWRKSERARRARGERILFTNDDDVGGVRSRRGREREEEEESHFFLWIEKNTPLSRLCCVFCRRVWVPLANPGCFLVASFCNFFHFAFLPPPPVIFLNKNFSLEIHFKKRSARVSDTHPARLALVKTRRERVCTIGIYIHTNLLRTHAIITTSCVQNHRYTHS